ncbi:MAG: LAGLIDADG family homing endonuclease [Candidatus Hermodarchaeota archaeon]
MFRLFREYDEYQKSTDEVLEFQPDNIRYWLRLDYKPHLLWCFDHEWRRVAKTEWLRIMETNRFYPSNLLFCAAENPELRKRILPHRTFSLEPIEILLSLRNQKGNPINPTDFTKIPDLTTYQLALCAFPLIQNHPRFDERHHQVKLYFSIRNDYPLHKDVKPPISTLARHVGVSEFTIRCWRDESKRPQLLTHLENRSTTLEIHQKRVKQLREINRGITSIHDLAYRLKASHFAFGENIQCHPKFPIYLAVATQYLSLLALVEAGYHPRDIEIHFNLPNDKVSGILRNQNRPYLVQFAATIPDSPPHPDRRWLPTTTDASYLPARYIEVPPKITSYEQLFDVLVNLPSPISPDSYLKNKLINFGPSAEVLEQWRIQFGTIRNLEDKILTFGYLIGVSLSDGHFKMKSNFNSYFKIALSKRYSWSKSFGDRVAFYFTYLGIPTKPGTDLPPQKGDPHGAFQWYSCSSPILTWIDQAVLGFKPTETHKETPAKIDWILNAPRSFQIKVLQGMFDGDGWANLSNRVIGIDSKQNQESIHKLLDQVGIRATKYDTEMIRIESKEEIRNALELPIFLSATGRFAALKRIVQMNEAPSLVEPLCDRPLMRKILQLHNENRDLSPGRISILIQEELGIVIGRNAINRLLKKGEEALVIDEIKVRTYFSLLEKFLKEPNEVKHLLFRRVKNETGYKGSLRSMDHWLAGRITFDVKLALSDGYQVSQVLLDNFPQLRRYLPKDHV